MSLCRQDGTPVDTGLGYYFEHLGDPEIWYQDLVTAPQ